MRERSERGKETACSEDCRGKGQTALFTARGAALWRDGCRNVSIHGDKMTDGEMTATSQTYDEEEIAG